MRYNVTYNQIALVKYNEGQNKENKLDIIDAIILQQLYWLYEWKDIQTIKLHDGVYFWVAYGKLISELPSIGILTNDGLGKRIKRKLIDPGLLKLHIKRDDNSKTYWQFTNKGLKVAAPGRLTESTRTADREPPGRRTGSHPDDEPNNNNTNDKRTNDKRESLSHFEYLKFNNSEEYRSWVKKNEKKIFNKESFIESFNDSMKEDGKRKDEKLIYSFKRFSRWWIQYQKESERPYVMPAYLKRIS